MKILFIDEYTNFTDHMVGGVAEGQIDADTMPWSLAQGKLAKEAYDAVVIAADQSNVDTIKGNLLLIGNQYHDLPVFVAQTKLSNTDIFSIHSIGLHGVLDAQTVKPKELLARVLTAVTGGRGETFNTPKLGTFEIGDLRVNTKTQMAVHDKEKKAIPIGIVDCNLLDHAARHPNEALSNRDVLAAIFQDPSSSAPYMANTYVNSLRKKLGTIGIDPDTVIGASSKGTYTTGANAGFANTPSRSPITPLKGREIVSHHIVYDTRNKQVLRPRTAAVDPHDTPEPYKEAKVAQLSDAEAKFIEVLEENPGAARDHLLSLIYQNPENMPHDVIDTLVADLSEKLDSLGVDGARYFPGDGASFAIAESTDFPEAYEEHDLRRDFE